MIEMLKLSDTLYRSPDEKWEMKREYGPHPKGKDYFRLEGQWVLRQETVYVDHDQYRHDLAARHALSLNA